MEQISLVLFEDNDRLRESLVYLLNNTEGFTVLADYNNCNDATTAISIYKPDVVLMDIDMPGVGGIEGVRLVKEAMPTTAVIMFTVFEDEDKLFECLCAGANGYMLKKTPPGKLFEAIQEVRYGGAPMSPSIARKVLNSFKHTKSTQYNLTPRELDVLHLLIKGYSAKIIAAELTISFDTARSHLKNIYTKLHVNCGKEAISKVLIEKII
jgi:DNA-binding NarL/FixJ family response regulator